MNRHLTILALLWFGAAACTSEPPDEEVLARNGADYGPAIPMWTDPSRVFTDANPHDFLILHGTASPGVTTAEAIASYFQTTPLMTSAHYVVGRDGTIVQVVHERDGAGANCCLEPGYNPILPTGINLNLVTLSIEFVNPTDDNSLPLTTAQKTAGFALVADIVRRHGIPMSHILGHFDIAPGTRARCPGPAFPWDELRAYLSQPGSLVALDHCADVDRGGTGDGTKVQVWGCNDSAPQRWSLSPAGELKTAYGTCLDVDHAGTAPGTRVWEWTCNGGAAQKWQFLGSALETKSGHCIDIPLGHYVAGQALQLYSCNSSAPQKWNYDPAAQALHAQAASNLCLQARGAGTANGTVIELGVCDGSAAQQFRPAGGGFASALGTNKCLDVAGNAVANGTKIQLWDCNHSDAQRFALAGAIRGVGGLCLDVTQGNASNGTALQTYPCNGTAAQAWQLWSR